MEINKQIRNTGLLYGIVLGIILLLLAILPMYYYLSNDSLYVLVFGPMVTGFLCTLALVLLFGFRLRKKIGGYWNFRQATTGLFFMLLVATLLLIAGGFVFDNYIAPDVKSRFNEKRIALSVAEMEKSGAGEEEVKEHIAKIAKQKEGEGEATLQSTLLNIPIYVICIFVFSLLFALLLKRDKPRYYNPETGELISPERA